MNEWDGNDSSCSCDCGFDIPKGGTLETLNVTGTLTIGDPLDVASGGTGANTASAARTNLGIQCGSTTIPVSGLGSFKVASSSQITFPRAFKSTPRVTIAPVHTDDYSGFFVYTIADGSASGFKVKATNVTSATAGTIPVRTVHWIAIGEM